MPSSPFAKDSGSHGNEGSGLGPSEAKEAAHIPGQEANGKGLAAHGVPLMDSLDSAFKAEPVSSATAVSSNGGPSREQQTEVPDALRASGAAEAAKTPVDGGDNAVLLPVSTLVLEHANSMELSGGPGGGLAVKLEPGQRELPQNDEVINADPGHSGGVLKMIPPLPSAGSIATALAFIPAEGVSGQVGNLQPTSPAHPA